MIDEHINRRMTLMVAGAVAITAVADTVVAQSTNVPGAVRFEGDAVIPEGLIAIYLEDPAMQDDAQHRAIETHVKSDGKAKFIAFSFPPPAGLTAPSPTLQVVARLEREDGWLLAHGSTRFELGAPVSITLNTAMY